MAVNLTVKYWRERFWKSETQRLEHILELKKWKAKALKLERENADLHYEIARIKE